MYLPRIVPPFGTRWTATPHELNEEMAHLLREVNGGIDRENIGLDEIDAADMAELEIQQFFYDELVVTGGVRRVTFDNNNNPEALQPIPDDTGIAWETEFTVEADGQLQIILSGGCSNVSLATAATGMHYAIELDGVVLGRLDGQNRFWSHNFELEQTAPVAGGTHRIRWLYGFWKIPASTRTFDFQECAGLIRWSCR